MTTLTRRTLLAATTAGLAAPLLSRAAIADAVKPFVDDYRSNLTTNPTADTNAAVRILSGVESYWQTGTAWNNGAVRNAAVLRANVRFCETRTASRTDAEAARSFLVDRRHQSYAVIDGLGPWAAAYRTTALAVTGITEAPAGTPATTISDFVPAGAPAGATLGAGSPTSPLGQVVTLVNTVRGNWSSSNPSKFAVQYPRPWRMTTDSTVVDTGALDEFGYPVYRSKVQVAPQLLRQRSLVPADDGGFPSGHTNALHLAALAFAHAFPERYQELLTCAFDLADTRITAGMHSPLDVVSGRILATALAAAILGDPANAELKVAARAQAAAFLASNPGVGTDTFADRLANRRLILPKLTYILPRTGPDRPLTVPKGAEVLLETRQPYLTAGQRRAVLRSTALPAGYALLDGPEQWGRLDLFRAADGYAAFEADVDVTLDGVSDAWRNDITGRGGLTLRGTGVLTLTGANSFRGGVRVLGGTLVAATRHALGGGDAEIRGGTLRTVPGVCLDGTLTIGPGSTLDVIGHPRGPVLTAKRVTGRFATVTVDGRPAAAVHTRTGVSVRILKS
ncbi:phosphoesterase [Actinoplanes philippinensis]|uniref:Autotransporter-associated beta strand repeat-containing protein n=1 Tax=Actinoplanes philippinensis TaxID=35752 RepID=A0A1I2EBG9_9ACTN|nr:phosphatase PAP2 family protein [Actinoplanes philippinensis]GIE77118.1 phosphoesterase [Actinoplanes philippinensis]SFE90205.1 autotransporter-associated beta strand repeat-containing protein [Actinoplanes philippinensis]